MILMRWELLEGFQPRCNDLTYFEQGNSSCYVGSRLEGWQVVFSGKQVLGWQFVGGQFFGEGVHDQHL